MEIQGQLERGDPISVKKLGMVAHAFHPSYTGSLTRKTAGQASLVKSTTLYLKNK
jgi:hypothetical protein